ncbi:MAG: amidohydrolase family protein [Verrucomicrobia bacterium]|nr:amidohydrolase family protein [Verrucomicrobiota bacterium]
MKIDNHVHIGVDPLFYLNGWSPYALDLPEFLGEAERSGIDRAVVFPFVSYLDLDLAGMREGKISYTGTFDGVPYRFENKRLLEEIYRIHPQSADRVMPFLMADPGRLAAEQVGEWRQVIRDFKVFGIKIQATIIQSPITGLLGKAACMLDFAAEHNLPLLIHSSINPTDKWSQCADILAVAVARPDVRFLLAHSCRFHHPSLQKVAELPNTWFDCSAHVIHCECAVKGLATVAPEDARFPSDYNSPETVLTDLAAAFPDKLIWGSDAPFYSYVDAKMSLRSSYEREVECLDSLPPELVEKISHLNTFNWLDGNRPQQLNK